MLRNLIHAAQGNKARFTGCLLAVHQGFGMPAERIVKHAPTILDVSGNVV